MVRVWARVWTWPWVSRGRRGRAHARAQASCTAAARIKDSAWILRTSVEWGLVGCGGEGDGNRRGRGGRAGSREGRRGRSSSRRLAQSTHDVQNILWRRHAPRCRYNSCNTLRAHSYLVEIRPRRIGAHSLLHAITISPRTTGSFLLGVLAALVGSRVLSFSGPAYNVSKSGRDT